MNKYIKFGIVLSLFLIFSVGIIHFISEMNEVKEKQYKLADMKKAEFNESLLMLEENCSIVTKGREGEEAEIITKSFQEFLEYALRYKPDVILYWEAQYNTRAGYLYQFKLWFIHDGISFSFHDYSLPYYQRLHNIGE